MVVRDADQRIAAAGRSREARAQAWRDLLQQGCILHFTAPNGDAVTAGPTTPAVRTPFTPEASAERYGSRWAGQYEGSPWGTALWVVEQVGRRRPDKVACPVRRP